MDAQIRRQRTFDALKKLFLRESLNQPLILVFEDLHWIDTETQGFLDSVSESVASANLLLLVNYRPEYRHEWGTKTYYTQLRLAPLGKAEAEELLTFLLGNDHSLSDLKSLILEKTEGTPFFMEEVVQTLAEEEALSGERGNYHLETTPTELHISPTVQGVLAARIDRLTTEEKELLQQLSVLGRQFPVSLVEQIVPQSEADLYRVLASLQAKEFLYEQPAFPEVEYIFKHALMQDVAYGTVLQEQRKALHEQIGQAMETRYKDNVDEHYGALAHHYRRSENIEKAILYLGLAGDQAARRSAYTDAIGHLNEAIVLLHRLPETLERQQQEMKFQIILGTTFAAAKSYAAPEVEQALLRAQALCTSAEQLPQLPPVLYILRRLYSARGEMQKADEVAAQELRVAQQLDSSPVLLSAHTSQGNSSLWLGDFVRARTHLEEVAVLYKADQHQTLVALYGDDPGITSGGVHALALWSLGYPEQAFVQHQNTLQLANEFAHPFSLAWVLFTGAMVHQYRGARAVARERAEALEALCQEHGLPFFLTVGAVMRSWACMEQGDLAAGIAQIR